MPQRLLLCAVLAVCHWTQTCTGFNIDERFPVIKEGKTRGSLFGFSVALHEKTVGSRQYLLLIGAPKEKAQSLPKVNETGAVYFCPITTDTTDCSRMDLVTSTTTSEMVEGMWLGVTVASQRGQPDGHVLACGHRYVKVMSANQWRMLGKCYVRSNDLTFDQEDEWQKENYDVCNPNNDHNLDGMCNMGISGTISETDVYLGSPGSYNWQGDAHVIWIDAQKPWNNAEKSFGSLDKAYSYIGYSVLEEKKLLSYDDSTVVTGAPRYESKGAVIFGNKTQAKLLLEQIIHGEQVGSYFGNSLAVTDLNNDSWNDLIVGAPFYFDRKNEVGGAVYIFMNENGFFQKTASMVLKGPSDSAFGLALAAIGDINQDGFQDFAVGAPFHQTGMVCIWMGSKKGISKEPSQTIMGRTFGEKFQTFGYSISGGMDVDDNSYPDILVGSLDDRIALLRARPVVHLTKNFTVEPKIVDDKMCSGDKPCITATLCMSFTLSTGNTNFKKSVTVMYMVEADMERRGSSRVRFQNDINTYAGNLTMTSSKLACETLKLFVVEPVRDKLEPVVFLLNFSIHEPITRARRNPQNLDLFPILSPEQKSSQRTEIHFQKACGSDNKCTSNLQLTAKFVEENEEKPYPSQGKVQVLQFNSSVKKIGLAVNVTNYQSEGKLAEDAHRVVLNVTIPDVLKYASVSSLNNKVECTLLDTVICEVGNPISGNEKVSFLLKFETSGITLHTRQIDCQLLLSTLSEQSDLMPVPMALLIENTIEPVFSFAKSQVETVKFGGTVMGESAMVNTSDVGSLVEFTFTLNTMGQSLQDIATLAVEFEWPYEVANSKWLLYLTKIVVQGDSETECKPPGNVVNMLNLTLSETRPKRTKRQVRVEGENDVTHSNIIEPQAAVTLSSTPKKKYLLECSKGTAKCVTFTCPLLSVSDSATIYVRSRLWNSTMLEDYSDAVVVEVKGQATLKLINNQSNIKMESQKTWFTVQIEPEERVETPYELPLWIIISAAVAGIVLLGIIILILWKLGFFKRAIYYRIMPKHQGVKIRRAERYQFNLGFQPEEPQRKYWITSWTEMQHYYY
ncbi:NADH dehydrogenase (ubiquinone) Fe-S protein 1 [Sarotherodon galilaeus]